MGAEPAPEGAAARSGRPPPSGRDSTPPRNGGFAHPTAGMVLHRVLAVSARTFLLNDIGTELTDDARSCETVDSLSIRMSPRPLWTQAAATRPRAVPAAPDRDGAHPPEPGGHAPHPVQPANLPAGLRPELGHLPPGRAGLVRALVSAGRGTSTSSGTWSWARGPAVMEPDQILRIESVVTRPGWPTHWRTSPSTRVAHAASS